MLTSAQQALLTYTTSHIGALDRVRSWLSEDELTAVPVGRATGIPSAGLTTFATLGLSSFDNALETEAGRPLRVELIVTVRDEFTFLEQGLGNCALNVATGEYRAQPGAIYPGAFDGYNARVTTPHGLLWYPFAWGGPFPTLEWAGTDVEWLAVVPVTSEELSFVASGGADQASSRVEELIDEFDSHDVDLWDCSRHSAV